MQDYESLSALYSHESALHGESKIVGTVYTPKWIANQMVFMLVSNHLHQNLDLELDANENMLIRFTQQFEHFFPKDALQTPKIGFQDADKLLDHLLPLKILDLCCGSGALLLAYLELIVRLLKCSTTYNMHELLIVIQNNIYGVDVDPKAIEIFKQLLSSLLECQSLSKVNANLYNLDSLNDLMPFQYGTFDLIIGNPPYIGEKNNRELFKNVKTQEWGSKYYEGKMDYFYFFIYKGYDYLNNTGSLCYLSSNYFLTADGAKKLRTFIKDQFFMSKYCDYADASIFRNRKLHACQYVLQKKPSKQIEKYTESMILENAFMAKDVFKADGTLVFVSDEGIRLMLKQMEAKAIGRLGDLYDVFQGIVSGYDAAFVSNLNSGAIELSSYYRPFYKNSDITDYLIQTLPSRQILYVDQPTENIKLLEHLEPYRERLEKRREVIRNVRAWYMLTWPREASIFNGEKVVVPQRASYNLFSYTDKPFYASADVYFIKMNSQSPYSLKLLTVLLNSEPYHTWLKHMGKRKGRLFELYATPLKNIPIPELDKPTLDAIMGLTHQIYDAIENQQSHRINQLKAEVDAHINKIYR